MASFQIMDFFDISEKGLIVVGFVKSGEISKGIWRNLNRKGNNAKKKCSSLMP